MKIESFISRVRSTILFVIFFAVNFSGSAQTVLNLADKDIDKLYESLDVAAFKKSVANEAKMSSEDFYYFFSFYANDRLDYDREALLDELISGNTSETAANTKLKALKGKYLKLYEEFSLNKISLIAKYKKELAQTQQRLEVANGPCTNMSFEEGSFRGWNGNFFKREDSIVDNSFGQHCIMRRGMTDPLLQNLLPVVPPGKNFSVRLGNVSRGGHSAKMSQTFMVTEANKLFTYQYAVVLEDPFDKQDDPDHAGLKRPHFQATLITEGGDSIDCAKYGVVVASNLATYERACVSATNTAQANRNQPDNSFRNRGCASWPNYNANLDNVVRQSYTTPPPGVTCGNMDIYFKEWSTVSVVLDQYIGQNVTIEFTAADCIPGGHLGYAYVSAECAPLTLTLPGFICSGKETKSVKAPNGFKSYSWTASNGGTITSNKNLQNIQITTAGTYKVNVYPFSDISINCPYEITYIVRNRCNIEKEFCETVKGSLQTTKVNLSLYNDEVISGVTTSTVESWHTALPTSGNKISNPASFTVKNGDKLYAVLRDASIKDDTVMLTVKVNARPNALFNNIPMFCKDAPDYTITGVTPSGGLFSGPFVTPGGVFSPTTIGSYDIKYKVTNANGCVDSIIKKAVVTNFPVISASGDTTVCVHNSSVAIRVRSSATTADSLLWTSSIGTFTNSKSPATTLTINGASLNDQSFKVYVTSFVKYCPLAKDSIVIQTKKQPTVTAPDDVLICSSGGNLSFPLNGKATNYESIQWSGTNVTVTHPALLNTSGSVTNIYPEKPIFKIILAAFKTTCPVVKDSFNVSITPIPRVTVANDSTFCATVTSIPVRGTSIGANNVRWNVKNLTGSFADPVAASTSFSRAASSDTADATFILTATSVNCGTAADSLLVHLQPVSTISLTSVDSVCKSIPDITASVVFTNAPGVTWSGNGGVFSPDNSASNIRYQPANSELTSGKTFLKVTTKPKTLQLCPLKSDSSEVIIYSDPLVSISDSSICNSNAAPLLLRSKSSFADSLIWRGVGIQSTPRKGANSTFAIKGNISFKTYITAYRKGCKPVSDSANIVYEISPRVNAAAQFTCFPDQRVLLSGQSTVGGLKSSGNWTSSGNGTFNLNSDTLNNIYTPSSQDIASGTVTFKLSSKGQVLCPVRDSSLVWKFVPLPIANAGNDTTLCRGFNFSRSVGLIPDWKYEWKLQAGNILSTTNTVSLNATADTTDVLLTVKNSRNCIAKDSMRIATVLSPLLSLTPKICYYNPIAVTVTVTNPPAVGTYYWKKNNIKQAETSTTYLINGTGTYTYNYDYQGCLATVPVEAFLPPVLQIPIPEVCENSPVKLIANAIPGATYFWGSNVPGPNTYSTNSGNGISNLEVIVSDLNACRDTFYVNIPVIPNPGFKLTGSTICPGQSNSIMTKLDNPAHASMLTGFEWFKNGEPVAATDWQTLPYNEPGIYSLKLRIKNCEVPHDVNITTYPVPKINIPKDNKYCFETQPSVTLTSNPFHHYEWYSETGLIDTTQSVKVSPKKDTYYLLKVTNEYNCKSEENVLVRKVCPPRLFVPNVITPFSNDVNAGLEIFGAHYTNFEITIFSRWGEIIFNTKDPKNAWNGIYRNENMPIGNYPWLVTYEGDSEEYKGPYKKTGEVTVVR